MGGPYDRDVAYLRDLADRLSNTPDADAVRLRFNDLYMALDRFLRLVASEDPNIPPELQMEAQDKTTTDSARVYEMLAAYVPHFMGAEEVKRLKYLTSIRSRVVHQHEDVTPQAVDELLDLTELLGQNSEKLGVTVSGPAARSLTYTPVLADAMGTGDTADPAATAPPLGYNNRIAPQKPTAASGMSIPASLSNISPRVLIGGSVGVVLALALLIFFLRPQSPTPGAEGLATRTAVPSPPTAVAVNPTVTGISDVSPIVAVDPTNTPIPVAPTPAPPARWVTDDVVNLRADATTSAEIVRELPAGTVLTSHADNASKNADGFDWLHVVDDQGNEGWAAKDFLSAAP